MHELYEEQVAFFVDSFLGLLFNQVSGSKHTERSTFLEVVWNDVEIWSYC